MWLGLRKKDLRSYEVQSLLEFNDSPTRPCGYINLLVSLGDGSNKRTVNIHFFVIPCVRIYNGILCQSLLETLDMMSSPVQMHMKYHNDYEKPILVASNLHGHD